MPLDFSKLVPASSADALTKPRDIFAALPGKQPKYSYLRDVQGEVLEQWHSRRNSPDLRVKMNTGSGKTLVGLLMLKSSLNEAKGPAVFVSPTPYLSAQVTQEARDLGILVSDDPRSVAVARGQAILTTHVHVLLNGKSKFGVGEQGVQIPIGSLVVDDAHACLATAEQQFTLVLKSSHVAYKALFGLLKNDLTSQSSSGVLDLEQSEPYRLMLVPYWAWINRLKDAESILHPHRDGDELKFVWPLLREHLGLCRCVFGPGYVEISPRCLPIEVIPSFSTAKRRIFMSATFADDSILVTDFNANTESIATAIAPSSAADIGERMILVPQELDPKIKDEDVRALAQEKAKHHNVVVIVPSQRRANFWSSVAAITMNADSLEAGVARLKQAHVGLAVIINKYDGIDLPNHACRLLILDGIPDARRAIDRIDQAQLHGSPAEIGKSIQMIEQGMGRGVRAADDYCVVVLMGRSLISQLFTANGIAHFTTATRAQFNLSEQVGNQIRNKGIGEISQAMEYCLSRDTTWIQAAKSALVHVQYTVGSSDLGIAIARRKAFDAASVSDFQSATSILQVRINALTESITKGWLMAELAEYTHRIDAVESQKILLSARRMNRQLVRPMAGIAYQRVAPLSGEQAANCITFLKSKYSNGNDLVVAANGVADDLAFRQDSYKRFHRAMQDAARLLGFGAQLPESEYGYGPDVLWSVGGLRYFVVECKNEATTDTVNKKDCNQLAGSINWFDASYDSTCSKTPVLVHPSSAFEYASTPPADTRVLTTMMLAQLREALLAFVTGVSALVNFGSTKEVAALLTTHRLLPELLLEHYTVPATRRPH